MILGKLWAGRVTGTNVGNVFLKIDGEPNQLKGTISLNEPNVGIATYDIAGSLVGNTLKLTGEPSSSMEGYEFGELSASLELTDRSELVGEWTTSIGSTGAVTLWPQNQSVQKKSESNLIPEFHSASYDCRPIVIDKSAIQVLGNSLKVDFPRSEVIVTVVNETEKRFYLEDFDQISFPFEKAKNIILFIQEVEQNGITKSIRINLGQSYNNLAVQGSNEAWVSGKLNVLKAEVKQYEKHFFGKIKRFGFGLNQMLLLGGIIFLPSFSTWVERTVLMMGILATVWALNASSQKWLVNATIYMDDEPIGWLRKYLPSVMSWVFGIVSAVIVIALGNLLARFGVPLFVEK